MVLHLIKLAVGVDDLAHMKKVQSERRKQRRQGPRTPHWVYTRNTPRRAEELLAGGSLYWVVRGVIRCRQELVGSWNRNTMAFAAWCFATEKRSICNPAGSGRWAIQRLAIYVDRVLKGANPAEMPIEQATTLTLAFNLKTAKALGLTIPPSLLARADQVIE